MIQPKQKETQRKTDLIDYIVVYDCVGKLIEKMWDPTTEIIEELVEAYGNRLEYKIQRLNLKGAIRLPFLFPKRCYTTIRRASCKLCFKC